jgi:hypothetical protein
MIDGLKARTWKFNWNFAIWLGVGLIILVLAGVALPGHPSAEWVCQANSAAQMQQIGLASALYRDDHGGKYPERFSQLIPDYIPEPEVFYVRCKDTSALLPPKADHDPKLVDAFSAYGFSALGDGRAVVFERLSLWSDHTVGFQVVPGSIQAAQNLHYRLPQTEFFRQYSASFKP